MTFLQWAAGFWADYSPLLGTRQIPNLAHIFSKTGRGLSGDKNRMRNACGLAVAQDFAVAFILRCGSVLASTSTRQE